MPFAAYRTAHRLPRPFLPDNGSRSPCPAFPALSSAPRMARPQCGALPCPWPAERPAMLFSAGRFAEARIGLTLGESDAGQFQNERVQGARDNGRSEPAVGRNRKSPAFRRIREAGNAVASYWHAPAVCSPFQGCAWHSGAHAQNAAPVHLRTGTPSGTSWKRENADAAPARGRMWTATFWSPGFATDRAGPGRALEDAVCGAVATCGGAAPGTSGHVWAVGCRGILPH